MNAHKKSTGEKTIEEYLIAQAARYGGVALKLRPPTGRGFPDRTLILQGAWVAFVELKRPHGGRWAKKQQEWAARLCEIGQRFYLVSTHDEVDQIFNDYSQEIGK